MIDVLIFIFLGIMGVFVVHGVWDGWLLGRKERLTLSEMCGLLILSAVVPLLYFGLYWRLE